MEEREFWGRLEYLVSAELPGFLWCDGLVAEEYDADEIRGRAWCGASGQEAWRFTLRRNGRDDWAALLPGEEASDWLAVDPVGRTLVIDGGLPPA
ncbi:hypothetical protein [Paractinoplanes lichenicola]|uniref:Uncharacterized protein n=1 Tax=Paractinoplanes lichenicola TaxID=2802976 RepID=A0ABS1VZ40_9ACTN|nr:hypothetical protein [Actinoplanes lichenicola]MBL7259563.1 hypothetical protein [Actinoplanes lichenicola]